jgi:signal transduction histidine kinase
LRQALTEAMVNPTMYQMSFDPFQECGVFVQSVIRRFSVATLTVVLALFCILFSLAIYLVAAFSMVGSVHGFEIFMSLLIPAIVSPPVCVVLLNLARSLHHAQEELHHTMEQLRILSHRLLEIQETERRYIALELHDEIGQALTGLRIGLKRTEASRTLEAARALLHENTPTVEELINKVRNLSIELRPSIIDDFGLSAALDWYVNRLSAKAEFKAIFHTDFTEERFSPVIELTCFRIAQEALTNAVRHSDAKTAYVDLEKINGDLHLTVRDDGRGFNTDETRMRAIKGESFGLLGMRERASLAGGHLELTSEPGKGTIIHARFPLHPEERK